MNILVAGGTGTLGSAVVAHLQTNGDHAVRVLSRKPAPPSLMANTSWARGDLATGVGITAALVGIDVVINCAGDFENAATTDVRGVARLAERSANFGVRHFFHVSIVGIDRIAYPFYQQKLEAERAIMASGVRYSIQRLPQFHSFVHGILARMKQDEHGAYVLPAPADAKFQPIDVRDAAVYISERLGHAAERLPDVAGIDILRIDEAARIYLAARGEDDPVFVEPEKAFMPDSAIEGYRRGDNTVPENRYGRISFGEYVREQVS